ncbi:unnamed protein product [Schistosoma margrebowiei]|uniref:Uncharacterized protein n=1 Tax=Schistosoma margrebowiei TaxID=48269 RepID=A0A183LMN7_9TREM|nr:unnamed protein product [Schistosoma margrebowiei]
MVHQLVILPCNRLLNYTMNLDVHGRILIFQEEMSSQLALMKQT